MDAQLLDWSQAVNNTIETAKNYLDLYTMPNVILSFGLAQIIKLLERYRAGERSQDLYDCMMGVS